MQFRSPLYRKDVEGLERVQRRSNIVMSVFESITYRKIVDSFRDRPGTHCQGWWWSRYDRYWISAETGRERGDMDVVRT